MRRPFNTTSSFLDMLFNILIGFFILTIIIFPLINPPTKQGDIELKAEFLVAMEWPDKSKDDVDLVVKTPASKVPVYYGNRDIKIASLDRDDLGLRSDKLKMSDGTTHVVYENWENVAIRKMVPGEYIINTYMYSKIDKEPTPVKMKVERLNPYQLIFSGTIMLEHSKQEETVVRFTIDKKGNLTNRTKLFKSIAPGNINRQRR